MQTRNLFFREGKSDKVYVATLDGGTVTFSWGRRGANMQSKTFGPMSPQAASALYSEKLSEKMAKGYRDLVPPTGSWAPAVAVPIAPAAKKAPVQVIAPPPIVHAPKSAPPIPVQRQQAAKPVRKFRFED